jgi:2-keto-4-pentenoate hydratase/2-oxohepta-3-ene-1,7-dioic acid hydratase in catechol pathway
LEEIVFMKLLNVVTPAGSRLAASASDGITVFADQTGMADAPAGSLPMTLEELVLSEGGIEKAQETLAASLEFAKTHSLFRPEREVVIGRPYKPGNILCVGKNYKAHAEESGGEAPTSPIFFAKWNGCAIGPGEPIVIPPITAEVDYEAELAVVIGKTCRNASKENARDYIAGYTCLNDISARDFQRLDGQWTRAKSQDTFGPFGPCIVTKDEIADPQDLSIRCSVNGRMLQDSSTSLMIFSIYELIAFISRGITLRPGDILSTGTPDGVGFAQKPPVFLKDGDEVVVEIAGVGELRNPVRGGSQ